MSKVKLYFKNEDATLCSPLSGYINDAKIEGLKEVTLIEAIKCKEQDYVFCRLDGEVLERCDCKKSICDNYSSKSGRGKCENRGITYTYGESITFSVE